MSAKLAGSPMRYTAARIGTGLATAARRCPMAGTPLPAESYLGWPATYQWKKIYDHEFLYSGPLFTHQFSHVWIDFREIQDDYMRGKGSDYFENSRRATLVQRRYAAE